MHGKECDYFGEWSRTTDKPHGRGILIGGNALRIGYHDNGKLSSGKAFRIATDEEGIQVSIGTEEEKKGKTKFICRTHFPSGHCESGTWIDGVKK